MRMTTSAIACWIFLAGLGCQGDVHAEDQPDNREQERQERLDYLTQQASGFQMSIAGTSGQTLKFDEQPILRYTNPVRNFFTDGVAFVWNHESEPAMVGALSVRGNGKVFCEFTLLKSLSLNCDLGLRQVWTPEKMSQVDVPFRVKAAAPADARRQALLMRQIIRRFSVQMIEVEDSNSKQELRLLASPLAAWSDSSTGVFGMCFGFAETNDPEALVVLRYNPEPKSNGTQWTYTLARMTSRPLVFELDHEEIYQVASYWTNPRSATDSYLERGLGEYPNKQ